MDEATQRKVRELKLKILMLEKELKQSQHTMGLQGWLKAGHSGQISRAAAKDRSRIEEKLELLREQVRALSPGDDQNKAAADPATAQIPNTKKT